MELYFHSRMRPYVVHKDDFALYVITVPEYVNMSRGTSRCHKEAMFLSLSLGVTCEYSHILCMFQE